MLGKKQLQEHEPQQPQGASLQSPGTTGTSNGRDGETGGGIDKQTDLLPTYTHTVRPTDRQWDA